MFKIKSVDLNNTYFLWPVFLYNKPIVRKTMKLHSKLLQSSGYTGDEYEKKIQYKI